MKISRDDYNNWISHPITQDVFRVLKERRKDETESLARGHVLNPSNADETLVNVAKAMGIIEGLDMILDIHFGDEDEGVYE